MLDAFDRASYVSHLWGLIPKNYDGTVFVWWLMRHAFYVWGAYRLWENGTLSYLALAGIWLLVHTYRGARLQSTNYKNYAMAVGGGLGLCQLKRWRLWPLSCKMIMTSALENKTLTDKVRSLVLIR